MRSFLYWTNRTLSATLISRKLCSSPLARQRYLSCKKGNKTEIVKYIFRIFAKRDRDRNKKKKKRKEEGQDVFPPGNQYLTIDIYYIFQVVNIRNVKHEKLPLFIAVSSCVGVSQHMVFAVVSLVVESQIVYRYGCRQVRCQLLWLHSIIANPTLLHLKMDV